MAQIRLLMLAIFITFSSVYLNSQTTYYVSSINGNDSNSGTSESNPWKSIARVNDVTFSPGDKILFKRGEKWEGTGLECE